jgi:hypothetical protein
MSPTPALHQTQCGASVQPNAGWRPAWAVGEELFAMRYNTVYRLGKQYATFR